MTALKKKYVSKCQKENPEVKKKAVGKSPPRNKFLLAHISEKIMKQLIKDII